MEKLFDFYSLPPAGKVGRGARLWRQMVQNLRAMLFLLNRKHDFPILPPCSRREYLTPQIHFSRIRVPFTPRVVKSKCRRGVTL